MVQKNRSLALLIMLMFVFTACSFGQIKTPDQKYAVARTAFNEIVQQYIEQAKLQPESTKIELRANVNPVIKDAEKALDTYYDSLVLGESDAEAKLDYYLKLKNQILNMVIKYGLIINE